MPLILVSPQKKLSSNDYQTSLHTDRTNSSMANETLIGLLAALRATPDNAPLRMLVLDQCLSTGDAESLLTVIDLCGRSLLDDEDRQERTIRLLADAGKHEALLLLAPPDSPEAAIANARLWLEQGRRADAVEAYRAAVAANPALEDPAFASLLSGKVVSFADARQRAQTIEPAPMFLNLNMRISSGLSRISVQIGS
jgi:tetratricopeptide (TPR) repeat protein